MRSGCLDWFIILFNLSVLGDIVCKKMQEIVSWGWEEKNHPDWKVGVPLLLVLMKSWYQEQGYSQLDSALISDAPTIIADQFRLNPQLCSPTCTENPKASFSLGA